MTTDVVVDLAARNGIKAIEWGGDVHVPPGDLDNARAIGAMTRAAGLTVSSYGSYIFAPDFAPEGLSAVLETAKALGTDHIRIWPGSRKRPSVDYNAEERRAATHSLKEIAVRAEDYGMTIGLEYHPNSLTDSLQSSRLMLQELPAPNMFFYWQPAPGLPIEQALEEISALGNRICHLHVFAWEQDSSRLALRDRTEYWRTCLNALPQSEWGKQDFAMLEFVRDDSVQQFSADADTLMSLLSPA